MLDGLDLKPTFFPSSRGEAELESDQLQGHVRRQVQREVDVLQIQLGPVQRTQGFAQAGEVRRLRRTGLGRAGLGEVQLQLGIMQRYGFGDRKVVASHGRTQVIIQPQRARLHRLHPGTSQRELRHPQVRPQTAVHLPIQRIARGQRQRGTPAVQRPQQQRPMKKRQTQHRHQASHQEPTHPAPEQARTTRRWTGFSRGQAPRGKPQRRAAQPTIVWVEVLPPGAEPRFWVWASHPVNRS